MKNRWDDAEASQYLDDPLQLRAYTSRLIGQDEDLVLHGGGNTSVKAMTKNFFGDEEEVLYVKGSGWDLGDIQPAGFAPVRLETLRRMSQLDSLSDIDMVAQQRAAMLDPNAPNPSVEAILHAIIPFKYVDHTHADAVVTVSNTADGEQRIREIYGDRVLIIPYVMPGFVLSKKVMELSRDVDWQQLEGMVLMNHGIFSFADDAKTSYERMLKLVGEANNYLENKSATHVAATSERTDTDLIALAQIRQAVSAVAGKPCIVRLSQSDEAVGFSRIDNVADIATRGPLTPDHVIRTKRIPVIIGNDPVSDVDHYQNDYQSYFDANTNGQLACLDKAPCWAVWPGQGILSFAASNKEAAIIDDICRHTVRCIQWAEALGGWQALPAKEIFEVEYWDLEQAKLRKSGAAKILQGKIALVTGAASGIGKACVESLLQQGCSVIAFDINPAVQDSFPSNDVLSIECDVLDELAVSNRIQQGIKRFGGLDILVSNAGMFPASRTIAEMSDQDWQASMDLNLNSHQRLLTSCIPFLRHGIDPAVVVIGSKNVPAPGPGASAYSVAKAGLNQLVRIAAMELAADGIRVNTVHPDAVFDTAIWTDEVLQKRAAHYGLSVDEYKTKNLLRTEITSRDVAELVSAMAGPLFAKTTGAQVPIDGGNDRVI